MKWIMRKNYIVGPGMTLHKGESVEGEQSGDRIRLKRPAGTSVPVSAVNSTEDCGCSKRKEGRK